MNTEIRAELNKLMNLACDLNVAYDAAQSTKQVSFNMSLNSTSLNFFDVDNDCKSFKVFHLFHPKTYELDYVLSEFGEAEKFIINQIQLTKGETA